MLDPKIRKEILRLTTIQLEATIESNYYSKQMTRLLTESLENCKQLKANPDLETLSYEECVKLSKEVRILQVEGQACQELITLIRRTADKSNRKATETEQKLNALCKRHGIENLDEYLKGQIQEKEEQKV